MSWGNLEYMVMEHEGNVRCLICKKDYRSLLTQRGRDHFLKAHSVQFLQRHPKFSSRSERLKMDVYEEYAQEDSKESQYLERQAKITERLYGK